MGAAFTGYLLDTEAQGQAQPSVVPSVQSPGQKLLCRGSPSSPGHPLHWEVTTHPFPAPAWPQSPASRPFLASIWGGHQLKGAPGFPDPEIRMSSPARASLCKCWGSGWGGGGRDVRPQALI